MVKKLYVLYRLPFRRKYLLVGTWWLAAYSFVLLTYFTRYARFGRRTTAPPASTANDPLIADIRYVINRVAPFVPWENKCRHQAYQARLLCRLYGIPYQISIGFRRNEAGLIEGHAWTVVGEQMITGFCAPDNFVIQAVYAG